MDEAQAGDELARVAAGFGGIYDTHDRDLGATFRGIGYLNSILEGIRIGEQSGARVIFSHFNPQGAHNFGRAPQGAKLINDARARGVQVRDTAHIGEGIREFERVQRSSARVRDLATAVAEREARLRDIRAEQEQRAAAGGGMGMHLRRLLTL